MSSLVTFQYQQALLDIKRNNYESFVTHLVDFSQASEVNVVNNLERLSDFMEEKSVPDMILDRECFNLISNLIISFEGLSASSKTKLLDTLLSALKSLVHLIAHSFSKDGSSSDADEKETWKKSLELVAFFWLWASSVAETYLQTSSNIINTTVSKKKAASKSGWDWMDQKENLIGFLQGLLELPVNSIWTSTPERDSFLGVVTKIGYLLMENPSNLKRSSLKSLIVHALCKGIKKFPQSSEAAKTALVQNLLYFDHTVDLLCDYLSTLVLEYDSTILLDQVLVEIGNMPFSSEAGIKSIGRFLSKLASLQPKEVLKNISALIGHLDCESYVIRCSMIDVLGSIISGHLINDKTEIGIKQTKSFFSIIEERFRDINAFVRTRVLTVLSDLFRNSAVPVTSRSQIFSLAAARLTDKNSNVRKRAMVLITDIIKNHPFCIDGGELNVSFHENKLKDIVVELQEFLKLSMKQNNSETSEEMFDLNFEGNESISDPKVGSLLMQQRYYDDALRFINQIHDIVPTLIQLLSSTNKAEVVEAMDLLVSLYVYKVEPAKDGVKRMVHLIWTRDTNNTVSTGAVEEEAQSLPSKKSVRDHLVYCYSALFLNVPTKIVNADGSSSDISQKEICNIVANRWIDLTINTSTADLISMEELVSLMATKKLFSPALQQTLFAIICTSKQAISVERRRGAVILLSMMNKDRFGSNVADAMENVVIERLESFMANTIKLEDPISAKYACILLQRVGAQNVIGKLEGSSPCAILLLDLIERISTSPSWLQVIEKATNAIFALFKKPDIVCENLLKRMAQRLFFSPRPNGQEMTASTFELTKFVTFLGHVAIQLLIHLDGIESYYKNRDHQKPGAESKNKTDEDLDQMAGVSSIDDEITDLVSFVKEKEILFGKKGLLSLFSPLVVQICLNHKLFPDEMLQKMATLSLCKLMCISSIFCQDNLQLLFTLMEKSKNPTIRSNLLLSLGDLTITFHSLIDSNIKYLYNRLRDPVSFVKRHALMVLSHLVLNGMVKVKGQLSEMAQCLTDADSRTSDLTKLFFMELAGRDNAIYNHLPDLFSHLYSDENRVMESDFQTMMKFIFSFLKKDRQCEAMLEKLLQRLNSCLNSTKSEEESTMEIDDSEDRQNQQISYPGSGGLSRKLRDIVFCLSLIPIHSDRSVKKLMEALPQFAPALWEDFVYKTFQDIVSKVKKSHSKVPGFEDFEKSLEEARKTAVANHQAMSKAAKASAGHADERVEGKPATKQGDRLAERFKRLSFLEREHDEADLKSDGEEEKVSAKDDNEDGDKKDDEDDDHLMYSPRKPLKSRKTSKTVIESDQEDSDNDEITSPKSVVSSRRTSNVSMIPKSPISTSKGGGTKAPLPIVSSPLRKSSLPSSRRTSMIPSSSSSSSSSGANTNLLTGARAGKENAKPLSTISKSRIVKTESSLKTTTTRTVKSTVASLDTGKKASTVVGSTSRTRLKTVAKK